MKEMADRILKDGEVYPGDVLKVGKFLNYQIDPALIRHMASEIHRLFADCGVTKILTVEASGIAIAIAVAMEFNVPMLFAKKSHSSNASQSVYTAETFSYTHGTKYRMIVEKQYLTAADCVLIVDDFLANGEAAISLINIARQAQASVAGVAVAVEKSYQGGHKRIADLGIRVESMADVVSMTDSTVVLREE